MTEVQRVLGSSGDAVTRFSYVSGTTTQVAGPLTNSSNQVSTEPHTTYTLNSDDRVTAVTDPVGHTQATTYTPFTDVNSSTNGLGGQTTTTHTANGGESLTGVTAPTGANATNAFGGSGVSQYLPTGGTDSQGNAATFGYDTFGNQSSGGNTAAAATASVTYHADGTPDVATDPKGGTVSYSENTTTHQVTLINPTTTSLGATLLDYDGYGRLHTVSDGRGTVTTYAYDKLDRVTSITYSDGTHSVVYTYDSRGNLHTRVDATGTTTYGYDDLGDLTSRVATSGGGTETYQYDTAGNLKKAIDGRGTVSYVYDQANELTQMTSAQGEKTTFAYNGNAQRTDTYWNVGATASVWSAHTHTDYDKAGRVSRTWTARNSSDTTRVFDTSYCFSPKVSGQACPTTSATTDKGLLQYQTDNLTAQTATFGYDTSNRLTSAANYGGHSYIYAYDKNGNRTSVKVDGATTQTRTYDGNNLITSTGYQYDAAGNRINDPNAGTLDYNGAGQLTKLVSGSGATTTNTYAGGDQNEIVTQTISGTSYTYTYGPADSNGLPVVQAFTKGTSQYYLDHDNTGTPLALHVPSGNSNFYVLDALGTPVGMINQSGTVTATYTWDPAGTNTSTTGAGEAATVSPVGYASGFNGRSTGLTKFGTRWDDTTTNAFTSTDPITQLLNPNSANQYTYAVSNPPNYTDPTGRSILGCIGGGLSIAGGGLGLAGAITGAVATEGLSTPASLAIAGGSLGLAGSGVAEIDACA